MGHPDATKTPSTRPGSAGTQVPFAAHEFSPVHRFSFYKCGAAPPCLMETSHSCRIVQGLRTTSPVATTHPRQRHGSLSAMRAPVLGSSGGAPCALPQFRGRSPQPLRFYLAALYFQHSAVLRHDLETSCPPHYQFLDLWGSLSPPGFQLFTRVTVRVGNPMFATCRLFFSRVPTLVKSWNPGLLQRIILESCHKTDFTKVI